MRRAPHIHRALLSRLLWCSLSFGCGCAAPRLPPATGSPVEILVVGEPPPPAGFAVLRRALNANLPPLRPEEPGFRLVEPAGKGTSRPREKNVLVLARSEVPRTWEPGFGRWLGAAARDRLARGGAGWFVFRDVWARGQEVVLVVATGAAGLDSLLTASAPELRRHWRRSVVERAVEFIRSDTASVAARQLHREHGFVVAVPGAYALRPNTSRWPDAVEIVRASPSRTLSVFWIDDVEAATWKREAFLLGLQQDAMWRLHGDEVVDGSATFVTPSWDPSRRELRGSWQNPRDIAGGAFVTDFVYDAPRRRLYGVQALLFAPGRRKAAYLVELEALLRTFHVEPRS